MKQKAEKQKFKENKVKKHFDSNEEKKEQFSARIKEISADGEVIIKFSEAMKT